jgi:hypothetical protein
MVQRFKTLNLSALFAAALLTATSFAFAGEHDHGLTPEAQEKGADKAKMSGMMGEMGGDMKCEKRGEKPEGFGPHGFCPPMGKHENLVATTDGGVVVLRGHELLKFDKNLKLTKQVDIEAECCAKKEGAATSGMEMCPRHGDHKSDMESPAEVKPNDMKKSMAPVPATPSAPAAAPVKK